MKSYKGTFEEPKVMMRKSLHKIKAKGVSKISEHAKSFYESSMQRKHYNQILDMISGVVGVKLLGRQSD